MGDTVLKYLVKYPAFMFLASAVSLIPETAHATQMHSASEGVIVHQIGHLFFLISMVILYFTIKGKNLHLERGWRLIQFSSILFVLWNLDALTVHFLDNQTSLITPMIISMWDIRIDSFNDNSYLPWLYYILRLDHLLSLPAMILFWRGLTLIRKKEEEAGSAAPEIDSPDIPSGSSPAPVADSVKNGMVTAVEPDRGAS